MENDLKNSENFNLLQDKIKDNENPMLDDMIRNNKFDYNYNIFSNNNPGYNNDENDKEINNINDTNKQDRVLLNQFGINNGNEFVSVQDMINKDYQNNNNNYGKEVIKDYKNNAEEVRKITCWQNCKLWIILIVLILIIAGVVLYFIFK